MSDLVLDEMLGLRNTRDIAEIERLQKSLAYNVSAVDKADAKIREMSVREVSELTRIDQYICIDVEQVVMDEMHEIVDTDLSAPELRQAAKVILKYYRVS